MSWGSRPYAAEMTCPACGAAVEPGARFCSSCGNPITARPDERRIATVLFADLVGFTTLSESSDPEQVKNLVDEIFDALAKDVTAFGGRVDRIAGDALLALFGAPVAHEDDAERAVRAALRMLHTLTECAGSVVEMRIGVNSGEVLVGAVRAAGSPTAMGDVVNTAQRLQVAAAPGTVLVGPATFAATQAAISYEPRGLLQAKGRDEPVEAWVATGTVLPPGHRRRSEGPLVGRDDEVTLLSSAVATAVHRSRAQLVLVYGEAGVGKSRIAEEVGVGARGCHGALVLEGRCVPYGEANVWWPVAEAVRQGSGIPDDADPADAEARCRSTVAATLGIDPDDPDTGRVATGLMHLMGYDTALRVIDPQRAREEATRAVLSFVEAAARERPVVILLSDLHWADEAVLGLIGPLLDRASRRPFVLVATARHELETRWSPPPGRHNTVSLTLDPLDRDAAEALLSSLADHELPVELRTELIDRSGGNPLFIEELVSLMAQQAGGARPDLPATLQGLISARIDTLGDEERAVLEDAAVWGGSGPVETLRKMAHARRNVGDVRPALEALVAKDVLGVEGEHWSFRSDLVREVAYAMLTKAHRAQSHYGIAEYLESISPPPAAAADRTVDIVASHYSRAADLALELGRVPAVPADVGDRALPWIEEAAHRATTAMMPPVALTLQSAALRLLGHEATRRRIDLLLARAGTAVELRQIEMAEIDVAEARLLATELGDGLAAAQATLVEGEIRLNAGDFASAEELFDAARGAFAELADEPGEAEALRQIGMSHIFRGRNVEAEHAVRDALTRFQALGDRRGEAWALQNLAWIAYVQGRTAVAEDRIAVSAKTFEELGDRGGLGWALGLLAFVRFHQGEHEEAGRLGEQILAEARERGDTWAEGMMQLLLAGVRMWSGHAAAAVPTAEQALALFRSIDDRFGQAQSLSAMARALVAVGRVPEALARLEEAQSRYLGGAAADVPVTVGIAGAAAFLGDPDRALAALALASAVDDPAEPAASLGDGDRAVARALALLQRGDVDGALASLVAIEAAVENDGSFPYGESVLALALAAAGRVEEVAPRAAAVRAAARSTYLDRATADLAEGLARVASGADGLPVLERLLIDLGATDDVLAMAIARLGRAVAMEALDDPGAAAAAAEADRAFGDLGIAALGWRRLFRLILGLPPQAPGARAGAVSSAAR